MAKYEVTSPDGQTFEITAPDNATEAEVMEYARKAFAGGQQESPDYSRLSPAAQAVKQGMDAIQGLPIVGGPFRALRDRSQAVAQMAARAFGSPESVRNYELLRQDSERKYQAARKEQGDEGIDWDRTIAGAATDALVASRLPGMRSPAPTMLGRAGQGAVFGLTAGITTPVEGERSNASFLGQKAVQAGGGAAIGGAAPFVIEPAIAGITAAANKVVSRVAGAAKGVAQNVTPKSIEFNLQMTLKQQGIDWNQLGQETQRALVADVRRALQNNKPVTPEQIARMADFRAIGTTPTRGQLTLDPMMVKQEQNLKGVTSVGRRLTDRFDEQNRAVFERLGQLRQGAGGAADDIYDAGSSAVKSLGAADDAARSKVTAAYEAAKAAAGRDADVPLTPLAQTYGEMRGYIDDDLLPSNVRTRLLGLGLIDGKQTKRFTINEAEDLIKAINLNYDPTKPAQAQALDRIRRAVNESIDAIGDTASPAAPLAREARKAASERFKSIETTPALDALLKGNVRPDDFIEKYVISRSASVQDVTNLLGKVDDGAKANIKAAIIEHLNKKAAGTSPKGAQQFSYSTFAKEVERIGDRKLAAIFSPAEVEEIKRLVRVGSVMNFNPKSVTINRSGTSQALLDLAMQMNKVPLLNKASQALIQAPAAEVQLSNVLNSGLSGIPGGILSDQLRARLAETGGLLGAAALGPVPAGLLSQ